MKKLILLAITLAFSQLATAQIVNIPDPNFKKILVENFDINSDGEISEQEALVPKYMSIGDGFEYIEFNNIIGIEHFKSLESLSITKGDFSDSLIIDSHDKLKDFRFYGKIKSITMTNCPNLKTVSIKGGIDSVLISDMKDIEFDGSGIKRLELKNISTLYSSATVMDFFIDIDDELFVENVTFDSQFITFSGSSIKSLNFKNVTCKQYTTFTISDNNNLKSLDLTGLNTEYMNLEIGRSTVSEIKLNPNTVYHFLSLFNLPNLYSVDLSGKYEVLTLMNIPISELKLSKTGLLKHLKLSQLAVKYLDLSGVFNQNYYNNELEVNETLLEYLNLYGTKVGIYGKLGNLKYLCTDEVNIEYYTYHKNDYPFAEINSYCSFGVPGTNYFIKPKLSWCEDKSEIYYIPIELYKNTEIQNKFVADNIVVGEGKYSLTPKLPENYDYFTITPSTIEASFPEQESPLVVDVCISPKGSYPDLEVKLVPIFVARPGFNATYELIYRNKGNLVQSGTVSLNFNEDLVDFVSANPMFNSTTPHIVNWDFVNLKPFETRKILIFFKVNSPLQEPAVNNGDILSYLATITGSKTDLTPKDNTFQLKQTVVGSYDPNDKLCMEGSVITPAQVGEYLTYRIRFENTGTFYAENIVVKDEIDANVFDLNSIVPLNSSHNYMMRQNGNKVEFIFEGIKLPFEDDKNDGYIMFKIKTLPTLTLNTQINNNASIYFDYNPAIITNTATTTVKENIGLGINDFEFRDYFTLSPNPANDFISLKAKNNQTINKVELFNTQGQILKAVSGDMIQTIEISELPKGVYILQVHSSKGKTNTKFVKN